MGSDRPGNAGPPGLWPLWHTCAWKSTVMTGPSSGCWGFCKPLSGSSVCPSAVCPSLRHWGWWLGAGRVCVAREPVRGISVPTSTSDELLILCLSSGASGFLRQDILNFQSCRFLNSEMRKKRILLPGLFRGVDEL